MNAKSLLGKAATLFAGGLGIAAAGYSLFGAMTWLRYGKAKPATGEDADELLDRFMPRYEICGRHKIRVAAPPQTTFSAAAETEFESSTLVRGIFRAREWILGSVPDTQARPHGLLAQTKSMGWGVLAEVPGREVVMGSVTKPWEPNPVFHPLPPGEFASFQEPGYVKIVWTLRADPAENGESMFRTETRAIATDPAARRKFRRYWALLSPGILLIRTMLLPAVKAEAERRAARLAA
jgi:hypothetical protein